MATAKKKPTTAAKPTAPSRKAASVKPAPHAAKTPVAKPAPAPAVAPAAKAPKVEKPKKPKLVRDSFTIPKAEYAVLEQLKERAAKSGTPAKKSEVLRAGIKVLSVMGDVAFAAALAAVPALKTGRPAKD
ncbi:hypothetical protein [Ramlibacter sp. WS9]|uniref:hypothetical protein n=1 Tax=Ramlibacter sp. WS9 TaxID=1882741 RepID=UPI001143B59C|nr:hypothetical protein [Ramlibacter sp. WS9]ROZ77000.1 hypothetical protein EEB15_10455 [Ramlibacter sp. WS9]